MIKTTRWSPDTCPCILEYSWDSEDPQETRKHTHAKIIKACPFHEKLEGKAHFDEIVRENRTKNIVLHDIIVNNFPELTKESTDPQGQKTKILDESKVTYGFDENREFVVEVKGSTDVERGQIKGLIDVEIPKRTEVLAKEKVRVDP